MEQRRERIDDLKASKSRRDGALAFMALLKGHGLAATLLADDVQAWAVQRMAKPEPPFAAMRQIEFQTIVEAVSSLRSFAGVFLFERCCLFSEDINLKPCAVVDTVATITVLEKEPYFISPNGFTLSNLNFTTSITIFDSHHSDGSYPATCLIKGSF